MMFGWYSGRDPENDRKELTDELDRCEKQIRLLSEQLARVLRHRTADEWEDWSWMKAEEKGSD